MLTNRSKRDSLSKDDWKNLSREDVADLIAFKEGALTEVEAIMESDLREASSFACCGAAYMLVDDLTYLRLLAEDFGTTVASS